MFLMAWVWMGWVDFEKKGGIDCVGERLGGAGRVFFGNGMRD